MHFNNMQTQETPQRRRALCPMENVFQYLKRRQAVPHASFVSSVSVAMKSLKDTKVGNEKQQKHPHCCNTNDNDDKDSNDDLKEKDNDNFNKNPTTLKFRTS